jgi:hypothetical protein
MSYLEPVISVQKPSDDSDLHFEIDFAELTIDEATSTTVPSSCWHNMFSNAVLGEGYPIPARNGNDQGLEISLEILSALTRTNTLTTYQGRVVLKGFNSIFVVTKLEDASVQWHLTISEDQSQRLTYNEALNFPECPYLRVLHKLDSNHYRHFVGWCDNARVAAGECRIMACTDQC